MMSLRLPTSIEQQPAFHDRWLQMLCEQIKDVMIALLVHRQGNSNTYSTSALWPAQPGNLEPLAEVSRQCLIENHEIVARPAFE